MTTTVLSIAKPGARVVVGDWSRPEGYNPIKKLVVNFNWWGAVATYRATVGSTDTIHPMYDYPKILQSHGLTVVERKFYRLVGVQAYQCLIMQKPKEQGGKGRRTAVHHLRQ